MNQLSEIIQPGQKKTYFLVFDVTKEGASQVLVFRPVDRSGRESKMRYYLPLPKYMPLNTP